MDSDGTGNRRGETKSMEEETRLLEARQVAVGMTSRWLQWFLVAWPRFQFAQWLLLLSGSQWFAGRAFWAHAGTPIGSWPVRERGGLRGSFWGGAFCGAVLGKLRSLSGRIPDPAVLVGV